MPPPPADPWVCSLGEKQPRWGPGRALSCQKARAGGRAAGEGAAALCDRSSLSPPLITPLALCGTDTTGKGTWGLAKGTGDPAEGLQPLHAAVQGAGGAAGAGLGPPKNSQALSSGAAQAGRCCWLEPRCWKQKQKGAEKLAAGLAGVLQPSPGRRRGPPSQLTGQKSRAHPHIPPATAP